MSEKTVFVDVTSLLFFRRFTGVQRVARTILRENPQFRMVAFDPARKVFVEVNELPAPEVQEHGFRRAPLFSMLVWSLLSAFSQLEHGQRVYEFARRLATRAYVRNYVRADSVGHDGLGLDHLIPCDVADLWILDIPKSLDELKFLLGRVDEGSIRVHCYLYDLIPLEEKGLSGERRTRKDIDHYLTYLRLVRRSTTLFALSKHTRSRYEHFAKMLEWDISSPKVLYPPWDHSVEPESQTTERIDISDFPFDVSSSKVVFALAPFTARKNLRVVFKAFRVLKRRGLDLKLVVVAPSLAQLDPGTCFQGWWLSIRYPRDVALLASVSDLWLRVLYENADVTVVPSRVEGFGLPIIEALNFGSPVVASNSGVFVELSSALPVALVHPLETLDWAEAIARAIKSSSRKQVRGETILPSGRQFGMAMQEAVEKA